MGCSLKSNGKTVEGKQYPDRNAQFEFIARRVKRYGERGEPSISVDTKKKEVLGNLTNSGRIYRSDYICYKHDMRHHTTGELTDDPIEWVALSVPRKGASRYV